MTGTADGWGRQIERREKTECETPAAEQKGVDFVFDESGEIDLKAFWRWIDDQRRESLARYGPTVGENLMLAMLDQIGGIDEYLERYQLPHDET